MNRSLLIDRESLKVIRVNLAKGETLPEHTANADIVVAVVKGWGVFTVQGVAKAIAPGDVLDMLPNIPHAVKAQQGLEIIVTQMQLIKSSAEIDNSSESSQDSCEI